MKADPRDRENIPCRDGGAMHRHVHGDNCCGDCGIVIIQRGMFVRSVAIARRA